MKKIIIADKPIGLTPLQLINKIKSEGKRLEGIKISYAGRLDPLAHGAMILLLGEENKNRNKYLNLDKEYVFEVLFGVRTDTYDALGVLENSKPHISHIPPISPISLRKFTKSKLGKHLQSYPPYSSKTVNGKPLYWYARNNKLDEIKIPNRQINIHSFELVEVKQQSLEEIKKIIFENINSVKGDFRQKEILKKWNDFFSYSSSEAQRSREAAINFSSRQARTIKTFPIAKFRIKCSSGTYVRSLANEMGQTFGSGAIAFDICRTKIGNLT